MRVLLSIFLALPPASAEVHRLTLRDAVELALKQNPEILLARFDELKAQQAIRQAKDPFYTKIIAGSGLAYTYGFPMSIEGSAPSIVQAKAVQTLFDRPRGFEVARAREDARGVALDVQARRDDVVLRIAQAYLDTDRLTREAAMSERQSESLTRILETVESRVAEGRELPIETKKARLRRSQTDQRTGFVRGEADFAQASLAALLGFSAADRVQPAGEDREAPALPESAEVLAERSLAASKEVQTLESKLQAAGLEIRGNKSAWMPKVDLIAQYGLFARFNNFDEYFNRFQRNNAQIGVSVQFPLLSGPAASARAASAEAESARLRIQIGRTRNQIRLNAQRSFQDLKNAESLREVAKLDLDLSRETVSLLLSQMDEGRATLRQVEEARLVENEKWRLYVDTQFSVERARLAILKEAGTLIAALRKE